MSKVFIIGDIHIGKGTKLGKTNLGSYLNTRVQDQFKILDWIYDQAIDHSVDNLIFTGDIFEEPRPHINLVIEFINWIKKCHSSEIKIHIILGNHDIIRYGQYYNSSLDIVNQLELEGVHIYNSVETLLFDNDGFSVTLLPFRDRKSFLTSSLAEATSNLETIINYEHKGIPLPYKKVLIGHFAIEGSIPVGDEIDDISNEIFLSLNFLSKFNYTWMGHVHTPQVLRKKPYIAHIGSMDISNFKESNETKVVILLDSTNPNFFSEIPIPTRKLNDISIVVPTGTKDTNQYVIDQLKNHSNELKDSIVRINISLESDDLINVDKTLITKHLNEKEGIFNISNFAQTTKVNNIVKTNSVSINYKMDVMSAIKMWGSINIDKNKRDKYLEIATSIYNKYKAGIKE